MLTKTEYVCIGGHENMHELCSKEIGRLNSIIASQAEDLYILRVERDRLKRHVEKLHQTEVIDPGK